MLQIRPILFILGFLLCVLAASMLLPAAIDIADANDDWRSFFAASLFTFFVGGLLLLVTYDEQPVQLNLRQGFALTTSSWIVLPAFAAVPFIGLGLNYTDSFFEAMSGLTTTGSTVLSGLDRLPRGMLLWRALLNWIGGVGIIVMAMAILPFLSVGGMQLFRSESSDNNDKVLPRAIELVSMTVGIYLLLSLSCGLAFYSLGMSYFDAVCHAMATLATGGFSTHDESIGFFKSPAIEWTACLFMTLGALPFVMFIKIMRGNSIAPFRDEQVRGLLLLLAGTSLFLAFWLSSARGLPFLESLRLTVFHVTSIVTTTGFATADYQLWGPFAVGAFFILMFIGGCAGSTSGGIKIYRLQIAAIITRRHLLQLISPHRIIPLSYNGRTVPASVSFSVVAFLVVYMGTVGIIAVLLSAMGLDMVTAISSSATAIGSVGPGLGPIIGPAGNFEALPGGAKWLLAFAMMLGRLELFTVLVLLRPEFWRG